MAALVPRYDFSELSKFEIPSYADVQKLAISPSVKDIKQWQASLKAIQENAGLHSMIAEQLQKMTMNGWNVVDVKKK